MVAAAKSFTIHPSKLIAGSGMEILRMVEPLKLLSESHWSWEHILCATVFIVRWSEDRSRLKADAKLIALVALILRHDVILDIGAKQALEYLLSSYYTPFLGLILLSLAVGGLIYLSSKSLRLANTEVEVNTTSDVVGKPLLFPCRTNHTRFFPKKHSFSFSYLFVGVPVGWRGSISGLVSADLGASCKSSKHDDSAKERKAWFNVDAADYLDRGNGHLGLQGKLDAYLESQGESPSEYPNAYFVTAPQFLGYSFNPVSFWYLYSREKKLKAMILEVNNTFDERRMYFLRGDAAKGDLSSEQETASPGMDAQQEPIEGNLIKTKRFTDDWTKDFHVSPFNSRKGFYSLVATDPFSNGSAQSRPVNNTITLRSSKNHSKLVARVFSTEEPVDASKLTRWQKLRFIVSWSWVGFATYPRIVNEAGKLFFWRKLHVWFRPEVAKESIGRTETPRERIVEHCFRKFLKVHIEQSLFGVPILYTAAGTNCRRKETFYPNSRPEKPKSPICHPVEFRVLTPLFYSRLVRYAHLAEFINEELLQRDEKDRTFWTSDPKLVSQIFEQGEEVTKRFFVQPRSWSDRIQWSFLRHLRRSPRKQQPSAQPKTTQPISISSDIRRFPLSALDEFVFSHCEESQRRDYRRAVTILLMSNRLAFDVPELIDAADFIIRASLSCLFVQTAWQGLMTYGLYSPKDILGSLLGLNAVHVWSLLTYVL